MKSGSSGSGRREQLLFERDLGVREQHRELGHGEAEPGVAPVGERLVVGQPLDRAVEVLLLLERAHEPRVHVFHLGRLRLGVVERAVLAVVVAQHERRDLVGHRLRAARCARRRRARRRAPRRRAGS